MSSSAATASPPDLTFSVVVPLHNKEPHILRALRSVLYQTVEAFEVIVVDDASTDRGPDRVRGIEDPRIRLLRRSTPGAGGYAARNLGILDARAEWIAFLDADDEWFPDHLEHYRALTEAFPDATLLGCGWEFRNPAGLYADRYPDAYWSRHHERGAHGLGFEDYLEAEIRGLRPICTSNACIRRDLLVTVGGFPDGRTKRGGDVDTWLRCMERSGRMAWSPHVGAIYHRDAVNMVTRTEAFTAACERETVARLLPGQDRKIRHLLKQFANRRTIGAWKQSARGPTPGFKLAGRLYWSADLPRVLFWALMSLLPPSVYLASSEATQTVKRSRRRATGWAQRLPAADLARVARAAVLRALPRDGSRHAGLEAEAVYLSDGGAATFFGYHDKTPYSRDGKRILAVSARGGATPSGPDGAPLVLGYFSVSDDDIAAQFTPFAETLAWCWQQGCMLQWHPLEPDRHVVFNTFRGGSYGSLVFEIDGARLLREYSSPIYSLSPNGRHAASLNFSRLERLRPGYGYARAPDHTLGVAAPPDDGLFVMDLDSGARELVISLATLAAEHGSSAGEHYVNHATFSPDGSQLAFLHLWENNGTRSSRFCRFDLATGAHASVETDRTVSHYCWRDERELLATTRTRSGSGFYTLYDLAAGSRWDLDVPLRRDGHPMFHPTNGGKIVTDTYPDRRREQSLIAIDVETGKLEQLARFRSAFGFRGAARCDLHPRWDRQGRHIVVDTTHRGRREMALVRLPTDLFQDH